MKPTSRERYDVRSSLRAENLTEIVLNIGEGQIIYFLNEKITREMRLPTTKPMICLNYNEFTRLDKRLEKKGYQPIEVIDSIYIMESPEKIDFLAELRSDYSEKVFNTIMGIAFDHLDEKMELVKPVKRLD